MNKFANVEEIKRDLVKQIKEFSSEISKAETFAGLLSYELKFRALQERFLVLRFLEERRLGLDIFDEPIPELFKQEEDLSGVDLGFDEAVCKNDMFEIKKIVLDIDGDLEKAEICDGKHLPEIQIDFNDKIGFIHKIFGGNELEYKRAMDLLHLKTNLSDSLAFLNNLKAGLDPKEGFEYMDRLKELVKKRFE